MRFTTPPLRILLNVLFLCYGPVALSQPSWQKVRDEYQIKPFVMVQMWGTYNHGRRVWQADSAQYDEVSHFPSFIIRRGRIGVKSRPYDPLSCTLVLSFDRIGQNRDPQPLVSVLDMFITWRLFSKSDALHLTGGYFRPQLGRESITSAFSVNSLEKSASQTYLRKHLVGASAGRATGLNVGGLLQGDKSVGLNYNIGVFFPQHPINNRAVGGDVSSPLMLGRVVLQVGDPEQDRYKLSYDVNYYGERRGLSIGVGGAHQGATSTFQWSQSLSIDWLANYGPLNVDGEWTLLRRHGGRDTKSNEQRHFVYAAKTGYLRSGINLPIDEYLLEPVLMLMYFHGGRDAVSQADAQAIGTPSGMETAYDVGINCYLNQKRLRASLHYTWRQGDPGAAGDGATVNAFFYQSGVGAVQHGNWLGLGGQVMF